MSRPPRIPRHQPPRLLDWLADVRSDLVDFIAWLVAWLVACVPAYVLCLVIAAIGYVALGLLAAHEAGVAP